MGNSDRASHSHAGVCPDGLQVYSQALRERRIRRADASGAPCLLTLRLLRPDPHDGQWLSPIPPAAAQAQLTLGAEQRMSSLLRSATTIADALELHTAHPGTAPTAPTDPADIHIVDGPPAIQQALDLLMSGATAEVAAVLPAHHGQPDALHQALPRCGATQSHTVRLRVLVQDSMRHRPATQWLVEQIGDRAQVRSRDVLTDWLLLVDHQTALLPSGGGGERMLQIQHPYLLSYLADVFERQWRAATPWADHIASPPASIGVTTTQLSIARLLVQGMVDDVIATRLGMNIRNCRAHIARLASVLGSRSRAELGFDIARSGLLQQPDHVARSVRAEAPPT